MSITYLGTLSLGALTPISVTAGANLSVVLNADLALLAQLNAAIGITWPGISANITALISLIGQLNAAISLGLTLPSVNFMADVIADLEASLAIPLSFSLLLGGGAGIFAYAWDGPGRDFGAAVQSELAGNWRDGTSSNAHANAVVLATTTPSVWDNLVEFFGAVPPGLPPGLSFVGQANIGTLAPLTVEATAAIIADLNARLAGMIDLSITPPSIDLGVLLDGALSLKASLQAALSFQLPGVSFQLQAALDLIVRLNAQISLLLHFSAVLGNAGAMVFEYDGPGRDLGSALTSAIGNAWPSGAAANVRANALVLGVVSPAVWVVVKTFFGGL
jgi:hypothetical protein